MSNFPPAVSEAINVFNISYLIIVHWSSCRWSFSWLVEHRARVLFGCLLTSSILNISWSTNDAVVIMRLLKETAEQWNVLHSMIYIKCTHTNTSRNKAPVSSNPSHSILTLETTLHIGLDLPCRTKSFFFFYVDSLSHEQNDSCITHLAQFVLPRQ